MTSPPSQRFLPLYVLFFISGFPALIYQIVWQRAIFTIYGTNIESITVVVAAFLLGLGLGSLLGGRLSKIESIPLLLIFGLVELGIGVFGFFSMDIFSYVGTLTIGASTLQTFLYSFTLILFPTALMGATLPILSEYLILKFDNVGRSIGILYAVNTFGSATACFFTLAFLMNALGQSATVKTAMSLNLIVGFGAIIYQKINKNEKTFHTTDKFQEPRIVDHKKIEDNIEILPFGASIVLVFLIGFISLSYEIVWARVYNFMSKGTPMAFPALLGCFLTGIGLGSLWSRRYCQRLLRKGDRTQLKTLGHFLLLANLTGFLAVPFIQLFVQLTSFWYFSLLYIILSAAMLGAAFPLICHLAVKPDKQSGVFLSFLYFANILGSVSGTLITGFILMDIMSLGNITIMIALLGLSLSSILFLRAQTGKIQQRALQLSTLAASLACIIISQTVFDRLYENLYYKYQKNINDSDKISRLLESKSGVIFVTQKGKLFGGGAYDGKFNIDLINDTNGINRAYALSLFHPNPKEILMVGLASGSWANVIAHHPQLEKLTIIEINPSYLELIKHYSEVSPILQNPKVEIIIDDGRRWLNHHPDRRFDAIVINTTYHWRAFATNILSTDFLKLIRPHLKPGGVHFYNTTFSSEAQKTGATFFPYAYRYSNFMLLSDKKIQLDPQRWRAVLENYQIDGQPIFNLQNEMHVKRLDEVLSIADEFKPFPEWTTMETRESILKRTKNDVVITDDNMRTEWRLYEKLKKHIDSALKSVEIAT